MNVYEEKQARRRERLQARSERLALAADAAFARADLREEASGIPFGQPILVGHHSEGKHRRAIEKADRAMRQHIALNQAAKAAAGRADSVGRGGISSDDPGALRKLREELAALELRIVAENAANKALRKGDWAGVAAAVGAEVAARERAFFDRWGYAGFHVVNRRANAKRIKQRIAQLEANARRTTTEKEVTGGLRIVENAEANRLQLFFPCKPGDAVRAELKSRGFRWAPREGAWQSYLTNRARRQVAGVLKVWEGDHEA